MRVKMEDDCGQANCNFFSRSLVNSSQLLWFDMNVNRDMKIEILISKKKKLFY